MKFFVNYDKTTGEIVSYTESDNPKDNGCPEGCETLVFASSFPQMFDTSSGYFRVKVRVDLEKKELKFIEPVEIPKPIQIDQKEE